jgi:vitamin B12 transporter
MQKKTELLLISVALLSQLQAQDVKLDTITVISATKTEQSIKNITSNVNVITSQDIEEKHYQTIAQALNSISGINFTSNGSLGSSTSVFVRGFDSKRVLVLIDGVRYNDITGLSGAPFEHLMISDIKQIEVVKGAQSGIWGADATAGVINIITKGAKKGLHGSTMAEYGSFDTKKYGASASYKVDNYYVKLSSQKVTTDGFTSKAPRGADIDNFEKDGYSNITSSIKLGFNINETNKIDISHTIINSDKEYDAYNADPIIAANSHTTAQVNDTFTNINFNHIDSFNEVDIYAKRSIFDRNYPQNSTKEYDGEVYEYGLKSNISYNENNFLILGADYKTFEHKNDINEKYTDKAVFLTNNNEFNFAGKTIVTESLRADLYDKFDDKVTGKFGVKNINNTIDSLILSANIGTANNVPTLYNLYSSYGNKNLSPENTLSYDIGVAYKDIKLTYFNSTISDMIDFDSTTNKYYNISGDSKIQGLEIEYNSAITDDLLIALNYTKIDAKDADRKVLARRVKDTYKMSLDYYVFEDLHFGLDGEYIGKRFDKLDEEGTQTGEYAVFNFVANYDISKNFSTYAKVDNILDRYYQVVDGFATAPLSGYIGIKAKF